MKSNMFKKTEKALYNYKNLNVKIENIDLEIDILNNDITCAGVSFEERTGPTNAFSSIVENQVIKRDEYLDSNIDMLKRMKANTNSLKRKIDNALSILSDEEYRLVELRYFQKDKKTWLEIGMTLGIDKDNCCKLKNEVVNKLSNYIYPNTPSFDQFYTNFTPSFDQ